ncbi:hypothetical protein [Labilithrix luteola]|nr:hypothetical protein [Labilithrix luteola]
MNLRTRSLPVLLLALVACGGAAPEPASPENASAKEAKAAPATTEPAKPAEPAKPTPAETPELKPSPPTVHVVSNGTAPRKQLRYVFKAGANELLEMNLKMSLGMGMGGDRMGREIKMPTARMVMKIEIAEVLPDGNAKLGAKAERIELLRDVPLDEGPRTQLEQSLASLVGMKAHATVSTRGVTSDMEFELPPNADEKAKANLESMRDTLRELYVPLPEEEVGANAKWDVDARMPISGAMVDVKRTYSVKELKADAVKTDITVAMSAPAKQPMRSIPLPPGMTALLDSLKGEGTGKATTPFARLVGESNMQVTLDMAIDAGNETDRQKLVMHNVTEVTIKPSKAAPANNAAKPKTK